MSAATAGFVTAIEGILVTHPAQTVVVACHGGVINAYVGHILGLDVDMYKTAEAAAFVGDLIERGDVLLVKGSRGVKMERIVEALDSRFVRAQAEPAASVLSGTPKERA